MATPHKHAEVIKAWADGHTVQTRPLDTSPWVDCANPNFRTESQYRVKPQPVARFCPVFKMPEGSLVVGVGRTDLSSATNTNGCYGDTLVAVVKLEIDPDTLQLISAAMTEVRLAEINRVN